MSGDGERLRPAPLNAVAGPIGREGIRSTGSETEHVLARLVWPRDRVQVVPAQVEAWSATRVLIEWWPSGHNSSRQLTWLPPEDVKPSLRWIVRRSPG